MDNQPAVNGCLLTIGVWMLAGLIMLGPVLGTCVPDTNHACPTDHDRNMQIVRTALVAVLVNTGLIYLLYRRHYRGKR